MSTSRFLFFSYSFFFFLTSLISAQWTKTNGPYGGFIKCIAIDSSAMYIAGLGDSCMFRSTNFGTSWNRINVEGNGLQFTTLAVKGNDIYTSNSYGVFYSSDSGLTWAKKNSTYYYRLALCDSTLFALDIYRLYSSSDKGATWKPNYSIERPEAIIVYGNEIYVTSSNSWIYYSVDKGLTWQGISTAKLPAYIPSFMKKDSLLFAGTYKGLYISSNKGASWQKANSPALQNLNISALTSIGSNIFASTGDGIFLSADNGNSWKIISSGIVNSDINTMAAWGNKLFAGTNGGGVFLTEDNGMNWKPINNGAFLSSISAITNIGKTIFASTYGSGIMVSNNNGQSWEPANNGLANGFIVSLTLHDSLIYAGSRINYSLDITALGDGYLYVSSDSGKTWNSIYHCKDDDIKFIQVSDSIIFIGGKTAHKLKNVNAKWVEDSTIFPAKYICYLLLSDSALLVSTQGDGYYTDGRNFVSTDFGASWKELNIGPNNYVVSSYKTYFGIMVSTLYGNTYIASNDLIHWRTATAGFSPYSFCSYGINVFAGDAAGVHYTANKGSQWRYIGQGLPTGIVTSLGNNSEYLFASPGNGIWRRALNEVISSVEQNPVESPNCFNLKQNYPNPFNPITNISYSIPKETFVTLKIFDALGRETSTLVNDKKQAGSYTIQWHAAGFPSGVYFYRLQADGYAVTKKLIVLK